MALVECELSRVVMSETQDQHVVVLREKGGDRQMPILIGVFEVFAIHRIVNNQPFPRPLTHELFGNVLEALGIKIERVIVCDLKSDTFYGRLVLGQNGKTYDVDSRPSDAIALAVQQDAPIFVDDSVLDKAGRIP